MKYEIIGNITPAVQITFDRSGEAMYTQSGAMTWMSDHVKAESNMKGGLGRSIGRLFTGESLFMTTYTSQESQSMIAFASTVPGEIVAVNLDESPGLICQKDAFLCAEPSVELK